MWHVRDIGEVHTGFRLGEPMEGDHSGYLGTDGRVALKWISRSGMGHGLN
jgi:hypothetical protein